MKKNLQINKSSLTISLLFAAGIAVGLPKIAHAESRYSAPPATILSGDLASPWLLQLKRKPEGLKPYAPDRKQRSAMVVKPFPKGFWAKPLKQEDRVKKVAFVRPQAAPSSQMQPAKSSKSEFDPKYLPQSVDYQTSHSAGTIIINTSERFLYLVEGNGTAMRYGVGVGREGFEWSGTEKISRKAEWPEWRPPAEMRARERRKGKELPVVMAGGPENPLGARAMYLGGSLYRIHGTTQPWSIGKAMSSGCIRMRNEDVIDLYERVKVGTKVIVQ